MYIKRHKERDQERDEERDEERDKERGRKRAEWALGLFSDGVGIICHGIYQTRREGIKPERSMS
jgi:hypothetical protein